jgi:acyl-CoA thioesterase FadM
VLARLAVRSIGPVHAGRPHTIVSWPIEIDGRKRHAGAALHDDDGNLLAVSRALWIELKPQAPTTP